MPSILCPHDFTPCSEHALEVAAELAALLKQPIELMHVYQLAFLPEPAMGMGISMSIEGLEWIRKHAAEQLEERKRRLESAGVAASVRLVEGSPPHLVSQR